MRILLVEDDERIAHFIKRGLSEGGYIVDLCANGNDAIGEALTTAYDLIILDIMLPGRNGFEVLTELRESGAKMPVIMLTARDSTDDKVRGLDAGADDYLTKPFTFAELEARVRALFRRGSGEASAQLQIGDLVLDPVSHTFKRDEQTIDLTPKEYAVLENFMRSPGRVMTRTQIIEHVWQYQFDTDTNLVDVYVNRLRRKIGDPKGAILQTVRGVGYTLRLET
jgi:two-component system, OmpR family, response regulator